MLHPLWIPSANAVEESSKFSFTATDGKPALINRLCLVSQELNLAVDINYHELTKKAEVKFDFASDFSRQIGLSSRKARRYREKSAQLLIFVGRLGQWAPATCTIVSRFAGRRFRQLNQRDQPVVDSVTDQDWSLVAANLVVRVVFCSKRFPESRPRKYRRTTSASDVKPDSTIRAKRNRNDVGSASLEVGRLSHVL